MRLTLSLIVFILLQFFTCAKSFASYYQPNPTTADTIIGKDKATLEIELGDAQLYLIQQKQQIELLNQRLKQSDNEILELRKESDSIAVFGQPISKSTYIYTMWAIIAALLVAVIILIIRGRVLTNSAKVTKEKLENIELEYEEHVRNSLDRDQKLRRQLQDEINRRKI